MKRNLRTVALLAALALPGPATVAHAQAVPVPAAGRGSEAAATPGDEFFDGEVRRIDKDAKKITLRHGDMPALEMPSMTMVFRVKDPTLLDAVKVGDRIRFKAEKSGGAFVVTEMRPQR